MSETHPTHSEPAPVLEEGSANGLDEQAVRRSRRRFSLLLDGGSIALLLIFLVRLLSILLVSRPLDPIWQGQFVDVLVQQGLLAFLGFLMLHLAVYLQPSNERLLRRLRLVRRLAVIPVLGYLLLVPLQLSSSYGEFSSAQMTRENYLEEASNLSEIREAIQNATSMQDMNVRLQALLQPSLTTEQLNLSLPQLRQSLLKANEARQSEISRRVSKNVNNVNSFQASINRVGSSLGWSLAFSAGAVPWGSRSTLFERMRRH